MAEPIFFPCTGPVSLFAPSRPTRAALPPGPNAGAPIFASAPLETAGPGDLAYMDNAKYADAPAATRAGACFVSKRFADRVPDGTVALVAEQPYDAFAQVLARLYPSAMRPGS